MENTTFENTPDSANSYHPEPSFLDKNRTLIKGFLVGFLILLMLIPQAFINNLVAERQARQQQVTTEISSKWADSQTLVGPVLAVPYKSYALSDGKTVEYRKMAYFLPEQLSINGQVMPEVRHRSLYDVTLYRSDLNLSGEFSPLQLQKLDIDPQNVLWNEAKLMMGINDARGLEDEVVLNWNHTNLPMEAGLPENAVLKGGLSVTVPTDAANAATASTFSIHLKLKGSEHIYFTPVGKKTNIGIASTWKDPAFDGQYLPTKSTISKDGFNATWNVQQVSRAYPQFWKDGNYDLPGSAFGVRLIQATDSYAKTERSVKYALLFIGLTFTVFFFIEIIQKKQVHPLQYILVGFALTIFYTLLLSISEYTGFNPAYMVAATATVVLIGLYVWGLFKQGKIAFGFSAALAGLYGYIFILIQLQDYALLFGSIGLFIILAVLMYFSRKIDWYGQKQLAATHS